MNDQSLNKALPWLLLAICVVINILLLTRPSNDGIINQLQSEKEKLKESSRQRVDSLNLLLIEKEEEYNEKMLIFERSKDSINELYEKSNRELQEIRVDIDTYLNASDSLRFAKFKQLITS